jgi:hypothetical protein
MNRSTSIAGMQASLILRWFVMKALNKIKTKPKPGLIVRAYLVFVALCISVGVLGVVLIPSLVEILAQHVSLEIIPIRLMTLFAAQIGLFLASLVYPPKKLVYSRRASSSKRSN